MYSQGLYPYISSFYRTIFGWIPFSFGDVFYAVVGLLLFWSVLRFVKIIARQGLKQFDYRENLKKAFFIASVIYIYFNLSWGLNYNRPGIAYQLQLSQQDYGDSALKEITAILLKKVNESRAVLGSEEIKYGSYDLVFEQASVAYQNASATFPFLNYSPKSIKKSMYGRMGNFLGFLGYYNPFTGEAQVNLTQPRFLIPYVSCHEMAHQLGYASESEANFVGYLAAVHSPNKLFHYSAYFDLFNYANRQLWASDSIAAKNNYKQLDTLVKKDEQELREYWRKSDNIFEPLIKIFYDRYLKANQQAKGVKSYNEVVGWLISYHAKYGKI
ncbi:hypothetical protein SAE01_13790 [Segetibacter aerophilus]|uniref:Amino acid permease n=2 Tax=Segetibacter aerophilus TaxID=670293 RepID=A0A512BAA2_9BACT|nr:hypothetical protein SAE01_13790 [Segetibacter aerophilus]